MFLEIHEDISSTELFEPVTDCEIEWSKIKLKNSKDLYIASYYMPHRNMKDLTNLKLSLEKITTGKPKHIIIAGGFNCPDIDWTNMEIKTGAPDKEVQQALMDLSIEHGLVQIHDKPTREGNLLDRVFTNNPSLIKSTGKHQEFQTMISSIQTHLKNHTSISNAHRNDTSLEEQIWIR
ncbi:unnamed protein product [Mytilus coruscus]|uniref:Endonuclease/exonuclease/phosphatase domain-containing protein n=1 Tax=Mytilus coruscus TaxID=42192 RepID=A0A6J8CLK1_MYTCO|nr:unnamed protein product [Mytilus coruscus]